MSLLDVIRDIGPTRIARVAGLKTSQAVSMWKGRIPPKHVQAVEELFAPYGHDRYSLRPDIYGRRPVGVARPRRVIGKRSK